MGVCEGRAVRGTVNHFRNAGLFGRITLCKTCQHNLVKTFPFIRLRSHYAVLGLSPKATKSEIKSAYIRLSKQEHPDTSKSGKRNHDAFVKINEAYNVLSNEKTRKEYDVQLNVRSTRYNNTRNPYGQSAYGQPYGRAYYDPSQHQHYGSHRSRQGDFSHSRRSGFSQEEWARDEWSHDPFASGYEKRGPKNIQQFIVMFLSWIITLWLIEILLFGLLYTTEKPKRPENIQQSIVIGLSWIATLCFMSPLFWLLFIHEKQSVREKGSQKAKTTVNREDDMRHVNRFDFIFNILAGFIVLFIAYEGIHLLFSYVYYKKSEGDFDVHDKKMLQYDIQVVSLFITALLWVTWKWSWWNEEFRSNMANTAQSDQKKKLDPNKKHYSVTTPVTDSRGESSLNESQIEYAPVKKTRVGASTNKTTWIESPPVTKSDLDMSPVTKIQHEDTLTKAVKSRNTSVKKVPITDTPLPTNQMDIKPVQSGQAESFSSQSS